jgi:RNA polymerase sigma-70 factor, ECF subfamily
MSTASPETAHRDDAQLLASLRRGDEAAFVELVGAHHRVLLTLATTHGWSRSAAEEVVRETWLAVLDGLDRYDARLSLRTWIFRIGSEIAGARAGRDARHRPLGSTPGGHRDPPGPAVDPTRFRPADHPVWPGHWACGPGAWASPEERLLSRETQDAVREAIDALPPAQRLLVTLRDVEGWSAQEACGALELTPTNQRALLHSARAKVRDALERHLGAADRAA